MLQISNMNLKFRTRFWVNDKILIYFVIHENKTTIINVNLIHVKKEFSIFLMTQVKIVSFRISVSGESIRSFENKCYNSAENSLSYIFSSSPFVPLSVLIRPVGVLWGEISSWRWNICMSGLTTSSQYTCGEVKKNELKSRVYYTLFFSLSLSKTG